MKKKILPVLVIFIIITAIGNVFFVKTIYAWSYKSWFSSWSGSLFGSSGSTKKPAIKITTPKSPAMKVDFDDFNAKNPPKTSASEAKKYFDNFNEANPIKKWLFA